MAGGQSGERSENEALQRLERSPYWVWTALAPERQWLVGIEVGARTVAMAPRVGQQVAQGLAPGWVPLFLPDGLKEDGTALLAHFGYWRQPERRRAQGPRPKPRWMPLPQLR